MKAKFVFETLNEYTTAENDLANYQIDKWRESQKSTEEDLDDYNQKIVKYIWSRLRKKLSPEMLKHTDTNKKSIDELINSVNKEQGLYVCVSDYWEENVPWQNAADSLFDEVYRQVTAQGWAM